MYDAFISYSHAMDKPIARALQSVIQLMGKPWHKRRAARIFRDDTSLAATPGLWPTLEKALDSSRFLILILSEESAKSIWVAKEIEYWLSRNPPETILVAISGGDLQWDHGHGDFQVDAETPVGAALLGKFKDEPKWVDLREFRSDQSSDLRNNDAFRSRAADIAAAVRGMPKEDLFSEELSQQKRALRLALSAVAGISLLALLAGWQAYQAILSRDNILLRKAQFITQISEDRLKKGDTATAIRLGLETFSQMPTFQSAIEHPNMIAAYKTLYRAVQAHNPAKIILPSRPNGETGPFGAAFSPSGRYLATKEAPAPNDVRVALRDLQTKKEIFKTKVGRGLVIRFDNAGRRLAIHTDDKLYVYDITTGKSYGLKSEYLADPNPGILAFVGDTNSVVTYIPEGATPIDGSPPTPARAVKYDYVTRDVNVLWKHVPPSLGRTSFFADFDSEGRYFLAEKFQPFGAKQRCFYLLSVDDWKIVPVQHERLTNDDGMLCIQSNTSTYLRWRFNDYGTEFMLQIDDNVEIFRLANGKFVQGLVFQGGDDSALLARRIDPAGHIGLFISKDQNSKNVRMQRTDGWENGDEKQFSLEGTEIVSAFVPVGKSPEDESLLILYADGQVREIKLMAELGRMGSDERDAFFSKHPGLNKTSGAFAPDQPCALQSDGWLTYHSPEKGNVKVHQLLTGKQLQYALPSSSTACGPDGKIIYVCANDQLFRFERQADNADQYVGSKRKERCISVRASADSHYLEADLPQRACVFEMDGPTKFDDGHCATSSTSLFISDAHGMLAGLEVGMGASLRLYDYDAYKSQRLRLEDLHYAGFDEVGGDRVVAVSKNQIMVTAKAWPGQSDLRPEVFEYYPYRSRDTLIGLANDIVKTLPDLTPEQRQQLGIELRQ